MQEFSHGLKCRCSFAVAAKPDDKFYVSGGSVTLFFALQKYPPGSLSSTSSGSFVSVTTSGSRFASPASTFGVVAFLLVRRTLDFAFFGGTRFATVLRARLTLALPRFELFLRAGLTLALPRFETFLRAGLTLALARLDFLLAAARFFVLAIEYLL
jgi:hypothetical protein